MPTRKLDEAIINPVTYATPGAYDDIFNRLRREEPVRWTEPEGYRPFWTVSKYNDIIEIERRNDKFINWPRLTLLSAEEEEKIRNGLGKGSTNSARTLVNMDGSDHRAHRNITQTWFL